MNLLAEVTMIFLGVVVWAAVGAGLTIGAFLVVGWPLAALTFCMWQIGSLYTWIRLMEGS